MNSKITSPKQKHSKLPSWYDYYAGYSEEFVSDTLNFLDIKDKSLILDPWNGSGTTTYVAEQMGYNAIGYDINPVMIVIARSRLLNKSVCKSLNSIGKDLVTKARRFRLEKVIQNDPLHIWMDSYSVSFFRKIERAIQQLLVSEKYNSTFLIHSKAYNNLSSLSAFYYVALFKTLRDVLSPFQSTNPTWIKTPKSEVEKLSLIENNIYSIYMNHVSEMSDILIKSNSPISRCPDNVGINLQVASSLEMPLSNNSIDAIITSPPYCTRIDYGVATKPELALIGVNMNSEFRDLRNQMIGTPTVCGNKIEITDEWGNEALQLINKIMKHDSKASKTYYLKGYLQYFNSINNSFKEIDRVLKPNSYCTMVVQDSYYKDLHVDLPRIFVEMSNNINWKLHEQFEFGVKRTMAGINKKVIKYRSISSAVEKVLIFKKGSNSCNEVI